MNTSWLVYLNLEKEMIECFDYVYFNDNDDQQKVYSNKFADILLRASIEIETLVKELYRRNGGKERAKSIKFDGECLSCLDTIFGLSTKVVIITYPFFDVKNEDNRKIYPLSHFCMTDSNEWNKSYQAIKHDKLNNYRKGNLKVALHSLAALYLLNIYFKDEKFTIKYNDINNYDNRFGSSLFSLNKPSDKTGFFSNAYISDESVYEYKLTKECQEEYEKQSKEYMDNFFSYIKNVPEMKEIAFISIFEDLSKKNSGISLVMNYFDALSRYKVDKMFDGLSSEEKIILLKTKTNRQIDSDNYDENYAMFVFKERQKYHHIYSPSFLRYAFTDSYIQLCISRFASIKTDI